MTKSLVVWWEGAVVGTLRLDREGRMRFAYAQAWLDDARRPAISFSLPKRQRPFSLRECRPFFTGVLPEESQRRAIAAALGLSRSNDFALLDALGGDVAGALSLWPEGTTPPAPGAGNEPLPLTDKELAKVLKSLPARPLLAGREGVRLSLAGAQSKLPVVLRNGRVALPAPGEPTTHIVKPSTSRVPDIVENEGFVMILASTVGLRTAAVEGRVVDGVSCLLVTRYDRAVGSVGRVGRLHQEDFCQALGLPPERKYAAEGGPTFKSSFDLLRRVTTRPAGAVLSLLDAAIFNVIVGNADAHGKNFSLLYRDGAVALAPLYDLLCTVSYPDLSPRLAMKLGNAGRLEDLHPADWNAFTKDAGLALPFVRKRVGELARVIREAAGRAAAHPNLGGLNAKAIRRCSSIIAARAERAAGTVG